MKKEIIIRRAIQSDYSAFRSMEERAWEGSGVPIIPEDMFRTWIDVNPELFFVAERNGRIFGHIYSQICDYDPKDEKDNRNWATMTDNGYTIRTHDPKGNCVYIVSISALGVGGRLVDCTMRYIREQKKSFLAGACRMPGLAKHFVQNDLLCTKENVLLYAKKIVSSFEGCLEGCSVEKDPTLTPMLSFGGRFYRVVDKYFDGEHDKESLGWAAIIARPNIC